MMTVYIIGFGFWRQMGTLNMYMVAVSVLTWVLILAGLILDLIFYGDVITNSPDVSSESFPWSVLVVFIAFLLFIIITVLLRVRCRNRSILQNAMPTSADSKMALTPSTKNQVMKRYYGPTPYRETGQGGILPSNTSNASNISTTNQDGINGIDNLRLPVVERYKTNNGVITEHQKPSSQSNGNKDKFVESNNLMTGISESMKQSSQLAFGRKTFATDVPQKAVYHSGLNQLQGHQYSEHKQLHPTQGIAQSLVRRGSDTRLDDTHITHYDEPETIFYRGKDNETIKTFSFVPGITTFRGSDQIKHGFTNEAFVSDAIERNQLQQQHVGSNPPRPPTPTGFSNIASNPTTQGRPKPSQRTNSFLFGMDQQTSLGSQLATQMPTRHHHGPDRMLTNIDNSESFAYNGTYIYRPFAARF